MEVLITLVALVVAIVVGYASQRRGVGSSDHGLPMPPEEEAKCRDLACRVHQERDLAFQSAPRSHQRNGHIEAAACALVELEERSLQYPHLGISGLKAMRNDLDAIVASDIQAIHPKNITMPYEGIVVVGFIDTETTGIGVDD